MPRLFFAVDTPSIFKQELIKLQDEIADRLQILQPMPNFKPEKLMNSHCTIRFLGNIEEGSVSKISSAVPYAIGLARIASFPFSLGVCGMFVHRHHARVIWVGLVPEIPFQQLQRAIDAGLAEAHILTQTEHSFHPHLTLFRFREPYRIPKDFKFPRIMHLSAVASEVLLIESKTLRAGPLHTVRERFPLA